jgi:hypothetical protein
MERESLSGVGRRSFRLRSFISVAIGFSALGLLATGIVLFVLPPGRIANWGGWTILGLRKAQWQSLHISLSALFVLTSVLHIAFNWRPLMTYFKDRLRTRAAFRAEWILALLFGAAVSAGAILEVPPFSTLLSLREDVKKSWDGAGEGGGHGAGAAVKSEETTEGSPSVHDGAKAGGEGKGAGKGGKGPGRGFGRMTLADLCAEEGIAVEAALEKMRASGVEATPEMALRDAADKLGVTPREVLDRIRP